MPETGRSARTDPERTNFEGLTPPSAAGSIKSMAKRANRICFANVKPRYARRTPSARMARTMGSPIPLSGKVSTLSSSTAGAMTDDSEPTGAEAGWSGVSTRGPSANAGATRMREQSGSARISSPRVSVHSAQRTACLPRPRSPPSSWKRHAAVGRNPASAAEAAAIGANRFVAGSPLKMTALPSLSRSNTYGSSTSAATTFTPSVTPSPPTAVLNDTSCARTVPAMSRTPSACTCARRACPNSVPASSVGLSKRNSAPCAVSSCSCSPSSSTIVAPRTLNIKYAW
mmetsp:Transcript_20113/g.65503  ORF Transcript_20113/g.65503 Transcript_20113/m.65503 type:complete len:286 (+) Transcript_20113:2014-2871(+)